MNAPTLHQECARRLLASLDTIAGLEAFVGLDGFVDEIIHVVDKRESATAFHRLSTISSFAERLGHAAGMSTNIELVAQRTKIGGNGPIMANALARLGLRVTYLGNLGYPNLHPVFSEFAGVATVHSIANPGHTDALEFEDGKILLGKNTSLSEVTWENIQSRFGREKFAAQFLQSHFIAFVNWTMLPYMSEVWSALLAELCPTLPGPRRTLFFDLADPEKRENEDIRRALELISRFERYFDVILGLNEKESFEVAAVLGLAPPDHSPAGILNLAEQLQSKLQIGTVAIHPTSYAVAASPGDAARVDGPRIEEVVITTGAGDHFNAGFCLGKLLGFDNAMSLLLAVSNSGFYVETGRTPSAQDLAGMLTRAPASAAS